MAAGAGGDETASETKIKNKHLGLLDLPIETQKEIVAHCTQTDLICVALVSKHFHHLASAQLYRCFHIVFPDDDDVNFDSPIDGLASGLDTFTTGEYDYAQHLRDLFMDTLTAGSHGEHAYRPYLHNTSCGKFLNSLLFLTLKRARCLESFRWNIRVELSRNVYQQLHRLPFLKRLRVRMQHGASYYKSPPPLPFHHPLSQWMEPSQPPATSHNPNTLPVTGTYTAHWSGSPPSNLVPSSKTLPKSRTKRGIPSKEPPTLSGFKNLKALAVLDIDDLDIVTELKTCVRNSASTLRELELSFSTSLAQRARKHPLSSLGINYSETDDDFVSGSGATSDEDGPASARASRAKEERGVQEAVLGRIFELEPYRIKPMTSQEDSNRKRGQREPLEDMDPRQSFLSSIKGASHKLLASVNGTSKLSTKHQDILDIIYQAAKKYVESVDPLELHHGVASRDRAGRPSPPNEEYMMFQAPSASYLGEEQNQENAHGLASGGDGQANHEAELLEGRPNYIHLTARRNSSQDDIDGRLPFNDHDLAHMDSEDNCSIRSVDQQLSLTIPVRDAPSASDSFPSEHRTSPDPTQPPLRSTDRAIATLTAQRLNFETLAAKLSYYQNLVIEVGCELQDLARDKSSNATRETSKAQKRLHEYNTEITEIQNEIRVIEAEVNDAEKLMPAKARWASTEIMQRCMSDYLRDTRGLALHTLKLYLVPLKASVLSQSIDLLHLRELTLLNVGNQSPIWTLLAKETRIQPLPLRSIYTDNVTSAFLNCASELEELHELFLLERGPKSKPESFAPPTTVTIDQIRRKALAKHLPTLKRLMIKNQAKNSEWDVNEKTMIQICTRGEHLEELAIAMSVNVAHVFLQYMSSLLQLRAIHILHLRNHDTCIWVMRELMNFIVDNLSHNPHLKLEYVGMEDDRVDRVVRPHEYEGRFNRDKKRRQSSKGTAPTPFDNHAFPAMPDVELDSDSETDEEFAVTGSRLRFKTFGPMKFYDVWGVKIFEKEMRLGTI